MSEPEEAEGAMQVDKDLIRQLAEMLNESDLSEIEVQDGTRRIVVKRKLSNTAPPVASPTFPAQPAPVAAAAGSEASPTSHPGTLKSPMVGTVYLSAEPGTAPFAAPGMKVAEGDTLLIIEAMKVMNPIIATKDGTVRQVLVVDGQPVEYDQPLMIVE